MKALSFALLALASVSAHAGSIGAAIKDLDDGTRASVVKELSKIHRYQGGKNESGAATVQPGQTSDNCDMNVASQSTSPTRTPTPRKAITVVTGNIVQICNR